MSTVTAVPTDARPLRDLYLVRFVVQAVWAAVVGLAVSELTTSAIVLHHPGAKYFSV